MVLFDMRIVSLAIAMMLFISVLLILVPGNSQAASADVYVKLDQKDVGVEWGSCGGWANFTGEATCTLTGYGEDYQRVEFVFEGFSEAEGWEYHFSPAIVNFTKDETSFGFSVAVNAKNTEPGGSKVVLTVGGDATIRPGIMKGNVNNDTADIAITPLYRAGAKGVPNAIECGAGMKAVFQIKAYNYGNMPNDITVSDIGGTGRLSQKGIGLDYGPREFTLEMGHSEKVNVTLTTPTDFEGEDVFSIEFKVTHEGDSGREETKVILTLNVKEYYEPDPENPYVQPDPDPKPTSPKEDNEDAPDFLAASLVGSVLIICIIVIGVGRRSHRRVR